MPELSGRCFCGALTWQAAGAILWSGICHCEDCRRAASSDYVSWFGVARNGMAWEGPRKVYQSSDKVTRSFCRECGAPVSFETDVFPDETHLYAVSLDDPSIYRPTGHLFWSEKLPWVTFSDDLPKHPKGMQHAAKPGKSLFEE